MRARSAVFIAAVIAAARIVTWWMREPAPPDLDEPSVSTRWLHQVHRNTITSEQVAYSYEVVAEMTDEPTVVVREEGALDRVSGQEWRTVLISQGDEHEPPSRMVLRDDGVWLDPGHHVADLGLGPGVWVGGPGVGLDARFWVTGLSPSAETLRDVMIHADGRAVVVGRERVGGVPTTRARLTLGSARLFGLPPWTPVDIWVDADDRLRRLAVRLPALPATAADGVVLSLRLELRDYGVPVTVEPPDPGQVVADEALVGMLLSWFSGRVGSEALFEELAHVDHDAGDLPGSNEPAVVVGGDGEGEASAFDPLQGGLGGDVVTDRGRREMVELYAHANGGAALGKDPGDGFE